jgi:hypothetical protein
MGCKRGSEARRIPVGVHDHFPRHSHFAEFSVTPLYVLCTASLTLRNMIAENFAEIVKDIPWNIRSLRKEASNQQSQNVGRLICSVSRFLFRGNLLNLLFTAHSDTTLAFPPCRFTNGRGKARTAVPSAYHMTAVAAVLSTSFTLP